MPTKAPQPPPPPRLDLPSALDILSGPDTDSAHASQALGFILGLSSGQLPQDADRAAQLLAVAAPYTYYHDNSIASSAVKLLAKLTAPKGCAPGSLSHPVAIQALWSVLAAFHSHFDEYRSRLVTLESESSGQLTGRSGAPAKPPKGAPVVAVDPESSLPGPSKYALDMVLSSLTTALSSGSAALEAAAEQCTGLAAAGLAPLQHHSCRIQLLCLRMLRAAVHSSGLATELLSCGMVDALGGVLAATTHGAVRQEALAALLHLIAGSAAAMQLVVDAGLLHVLVQHVMEPDTGVVQTPASVAGEAQPEEAATQPPPPPPRLDVSRPVASSPAKLQSLSAQLLLALATHHHGAAQEMLRMGVMQVLLGLLPEPRLPDLPPPPPSGAKRRSSATDTIFTALLPGMAVPGTPSRGGHLSKPSSPLLPHTPAPKDAWMEYLERRSYPPPAAKAPSPELQASLLRLLACLLAEPGVQDYWWFVHASRRLHLRLMHMLRTEPAEEAQPAPAQPPRAVAPPALAPQAPAPQPAPPGPDPSQPPFPPAVRAGALRCLLQLMHHPQWLRLVPHLSELQRTVTSPDIWSEEMMVPMAEILQRVLQDRVPPPPRGAEAAAAAGVPAAPSPTGAPSANQPGVANHEPNGLPAVANGVTAGPLTDAEIIDALKQMAKMVRGSHDPGVVGAVARALMVLPDSALYAPPWPPLPSQPPTPPPPPLPTSQYLWDALGRPVMTDGVKLVHV